MTGTAFVDLDAYLEAEVERVEDALERAVERLGARLVDVPSGEALGAAIRHGVLSGGKRLRPVLCVAAYRAAREAASDAADRAAREAASDAADPGSAAIYDLAVSLEMIHAYSLMHDDLPCMDDAELRRGRPTTHREHGEDTTIRAGVVLIPASALQALEACSTLGLDASTARRAVRRLMEAAGAGGMVGGQWLDLLGEGQTLGSQALGELHRRKTGALLAASLVVGALAARASDEVVEALEDYGRSIGLAFQIADDILDATASADALGKNPSDSALDKSTYVALHGLEGARERARAQVDDALAALGRAGLVSPPLEALARFVVERRR